MEENEAICQDRILSREDDQDISGPYLKRKVVIERTELRMNPDFPEDTKCDCGHTYYRHFDGYENWAPVGCKYCQCGMWQPRVEKAGLIPYYRDMNQIYMMFMIPSDPKYGGSRPQISKGFMDPTDESSKAGAIREASEELGFDIKNVKYEEIGVYKVHGATKIQDEREYSFALYVAEILNKDDFNEPHFETGSVVWMTPAQFQLYGKPEHRAMVKEAFIQIARHHGYRDQKVNDGGDYGDFQEVTE